ncbi:hypothetical protein [Aureimonas sp. AU4]|uniref:hypothetical protein n=1 Tax=Aureimonas sp. AU4 TaxID=1638163 RepID=UPI000783DF50|nr:hypothetical protein [Aureimonas sp. AU4]
MSEIAKTNADGTEIRTDGSKVATETDPSGETESERVAREESKLPNGGQSPEYTDGEPHGIADPGPRTGA